MSLVPIKVRKLSFREESQITEKFLACPCMSNKSSRQTVLTYLKKTRPQSIERSDIDKIDIMNIMQASRQFLGGLQELVEAVGFLDNGTIPVQQMEELLQFIFFDPQSPLINQELFGELLENIAEVNVARNDLIRLYRASVPGGWNFPDFRNNDEVEMLALVVRDLTRTDLQDTHTWPLLTFVKLLTKYAHEQSVRDALELWIKKAAKAAGIAEQNISPRAETVPATPLPETSFHLLIKFEPDRFAKKSGEVFFIRAWFVREQRGKVDPEPVETKEEIYHLGTKPTFLKDLIMLCASHAHHFTVELFLPFTLLNHENCDVHQWTYDADFGDRWVALEYPLVLRSYDRIYEGNVILWNDWKENWTICENAFNGNALKILKEKDYTEKGGFLSVHLKKFGCVAMTFVPPKFDSRAHIFKKMVNAGTSIALWPRSTVEAFDEETVEQIYRTLLTGCDFSKLPDMILEKRREALEDKSSLVNMLTLFWDKPHPLPPDIKAPLFAFPAERE